MKKKKYVPICLRSIKKRIEDRPERWGIGTYDKHGDIGMLYGPFNSELKALELIGIKDSVIMHFHKNKTLSEASWKWSEKGYWKQLC